MSASGENMERIVRARDHHNRTCASGQAATAVQMNPADVERCGWEEGDVIAGLTVQVSPSQTAGFLHVVCPGEGGELPAEEVRESDTVRVHLPRREPVIA